MPFPFTNLIFEGGGVKGVAYAGSIEVLEKRGILDNIVRVGGTSAGAITATLLALRYSPDELRKLMLDLNFEQFKDGWFLGDVFRLLKKYGWYKGDAFLDFIEKKIHHKTGSKHTTFDELSQKGFRDLYVVGTDLSTHEYQVFSRYSTGSVRVADAVRISMSIPLFFASRQLKNDIYVDGGVLNNYPITLFDRDCPKPQTLGFHLGKHVVKRQEINNFEQYVGNLFETLLDVQDDALWNEPENLQRTVCINNLGIQTTDFSITREQKEALMKQGHEATTNYLREFEQGGPITVCDGAKRNRRRD